MNVDRVGGAIAGIELRRVAAALRVVVAALLLAIAGIGLQHGEVVVLWLVPVAWAVLVLDPRREEPRARER